MLNCGNKDSDQGPHFLACRLEHEEQIPAASQPMVGPKAYNYEAIRNFGFNQRNVESKNEFLLSLNQDNNIAYYAPIAS